MSKYIVTIPITAWSETVVEANSKKEAIEKAIDETKLEDVLEWDCHKHIVEGNVFHGLLNDISVEEMGE